MHVYLYLVALLAATSTQSSGAGETPGLSGIVVDESGEPVEGAVIAVFSSRIRSDEPTPNATSAADGTFALESPAGPPLTVAVHAAGFEPFRDTELGAESFPLRVVLETAALSVTGRVLDGETHEPIAGAFVESRAVASGTGSLSTLVSDSSSR